MLKDFCESVKVVARDRMGSSLYGSFAIAWIILNWKAWYITFFVDQTLILTKFDQLKIDYLLGNYQATPFFWSGLWASFKLVILPLIFSFLFVFLISKLDLCFFKKSTSNEMLKRSEKLRQEKGLLEEREENVRIEENIQKKESSNEEKWNTDYAEVSLQSNFQRAMDSMKTCLYRHDGYLNYNAYRMPPDDITYLHVNNLVDYANQNKTVISATEKGKFFLKKFINS